MKAKIIILFFLGLCLSSCVSTNFDEYKSYDNLKIEKKYYEIIEPNNNKNFVKVGVHTIFNRQNSYFLSVSFKNNENNEVIIESTCYGIIKKSSNQQNIYIKEIDNKCTKPDTITIRFSDKIYKFYHN